MATQLTINKTKNGYNAVHKGCQNEQQEFSFENSDNLCHHILSVLHEDDNGTFIARRAGSIFRDTCEGLSVEQMRDELGRLREENKVMKVAGDKLRAQLNDTVESLNRSIRTADARGDLIAELQAKLVKKKK